jgi:hypothetical protein
MRILNFGKLVEEKGTITILHELLLLIQCKRIFIVYVKMYVACGF